MRNLELSELQEINGGGPIKDFIKGFYRTMGSFYHGVIDGLFNNESDV
ncbi:hypothetical protein [Leeuwenhoekiella marinoflava]